MVTLLKLKLLLNALELRMKKNLKFLRDHHTLSISHARKKNNGGLSLGSHPQTL